jgi:hypothetical protein
MKRNLPLQLSSQFRNCAITFYFAPPKSSQTPILCNTCSAVVKSTENSLGGSLSFKSTTSSSQHPRVRRPSFSQNLSPTFPLTHPVHPSTRTFPMNISSTLPLMILGMATSSYTYELKISVNIYHEMIVDAFFIKPLVISSLETSYTGGASTPFYATA